VKSWSTIAAYIARATGEPFEPRPPSSVGGGCINTAVRLSDQHRSFFVKLNSAERLEMFAAEAEGLGELAGSHCIRVPEPVCHGTVDGQAYLVMEYIALGRPGGDGPEQAGRQLAALHRNGRERFGWHRDNTIGSTHQPNASSADWVEFWRGQRLGFQLRLAARNGHGGRLQSQGEKLLERFPALIDHDPQPAPATSTPPTTMPGRWIRATRCARPSTTSTTSSTTSTCSAVATWGRRRG
jgi:fructosamine-3-kinase